MTNIREDKGYTYGIHSYLQNHIQQSAWIVSTEAGKDVCEAAIKEIYHEMEVLKETLVDDEELLLVKNYMMGTYLGDLDGPFKIIARWKNLILNGLDEDYFNDSVNAVRVSFVLPDIRHKPRSKKSTTQSIQHHHLFKIGMVTVGEMSRYSYCALHTIRIIHYPEFFFCGRFGCVSRQ